MEEWGIIITTITTILPFPTNQRQVQVRSAESPWILLSILADQRSGESRCCCAAEGDPKGRRKGFGLMGFGSKLRAPDPLKLLLISRLISMEPEKDVCAARA